MFSGAYGARRIHRDLREEDKVRAGQERVARPMRQAEIGAGVVVGWSMANHLRTELVPTVLFVRFQPTRHVEKWTHRAWSAMKTSMKFWWFFLCCVAFAAALTACKSGEPAPTEDVADVETTAAADESANARATPEDKPAGKPEIPAPPDVAAVPKDAERSESGLAWKVLQEGEGKIRPIRYDTVTLSYTGWTPDGRMFASAPKIRGKVEDLVPGWTEGVQLMLPGEKRRFWIPGKLAYGEANGDDRSVRPEQPRGMVVFDIELIDFQRNPVPARATPEDVAEIPKDAKKSKSGLAWRVLRKGTGKEHPTATSTVSVHYAGWTTDGKMFDTSLALMGKPATFALSDAMPGWQEGVQMMVVGEVRRLWIPENLAYAGRPSAPRGMLVYDVQLVGFQD